MINNPKQAGKAEFYERIDDLIAIMEAQHLTGAELDFKNGWKFRLNHPTRQKILESGGNPYAKTALEAQS